MAYYAMPYRGEEFGFPKILPENLPSSGFEGWMIQQGYPQSLITDIPGFEGTGWFCHCYENDNLASKFHPSNPEYRDPYDPTMVEVPSEDPPVEEDPTANTTFSTVTISE